MQNTTNKAGKHRSTPSEANQFGACPVKNENEMNKPPQSTFSRSRNYAY